MVFGHIIVNMGTIYAIISILIRAPWLGTNEGEKVRG